MQPRHRQSSAAQMAQHYEMRKNRQKKREERENKEAKWGIKTHKKNHYARTISYRDPCAMTFRECKILAVLVCEE